jgi:hypothetical protein
MPTDCKQVRIQFNWAAVTTERIGLLIGVCDSLLLQEMNCKKLAEMTSSLLYKIEEVTTGLMQTQTLATISASFLQILSNK